MNIQQLEDSRVKLTLLGLSNYKYVTDIASQKDLVQYSPSHISNPEALRAYVQTAVDGYYHKTCIPFLVFDKSKNAYAGCTRFMNIDSKNKVLDIGATWIGYEFQGTGLNKHMKYLMLKYAFENLKFEKVEFKADERNIRSRKAIEYVGGSLEGILRQNIYLLNGYKRNTCIYGILNTEWDALKATVFKDFEAE
ncbi:GNAT family N-acetyltransferase [Formosa algae]|uniref:RimJ/RimL family protein N-acetyltransferase n=1 Tax=Formosa algae TaxID=225843 RepID=A0A9X0YM03_9FLAO|nr:GNAT family protein [Formosa algae]MBP1841046.1 RimJ/RimL family protein N-acetyltransferase [Formosa algae]MDQ0336534.1 RimJ/RimL family protein N-acetyltransferase [Formosa algae]OEI81492.1 GNAT family N-acetyltransferase [Formosa algae]PNW26619.1 GNAT family N-acetyltransferase [Formosa algae]